MLREDEKSNVTPDWISPPNGDPPKIEKQPHPGRLSIRCIKGANVRRKDQNRTRTSINPCLRFTLAPGYTNSIEKTTNSNTSVKDHSNPSFGNEIVSFDVTNLDDCITNNAIKLKIEVLDKTARGLEELGEATISALRFFTDKTNNVIEWFPITQRGDDTSNSSIYLEITFHPVKQGVCMLTLLKCSEILDDSLKLFFKVGDHPPKETKVIEGDNAKHSAEKIFLNISDDNWFDDLTIQVRNDVTSKDKVFSEKSIELLQLMSDDDKGDEDESNQMSVVLCQERDKERVVIMKLQMTVLFLQAGELTIRNICGKNLQSMGGKLNPFLLFKSFGRASTLQVETKTTKGGDIWSWNEELLHLLVTDNHILEIQCFDNDAFNGSHELIGNAEISLLPVFQMGHVQNNIQLKIENKVCLLSTLLLFTITGILRILLNSCSQKVWCNSYIW